MTDPTADEQRAAYYREQVTLGSEHSDSRRDGLTGHEASSVIDQDEWQPAILPEPDHRVLVKYIGGPLDGTWDKVLGATYLMVDKDGVAYDEYQRSRSIYVNGDYYANEANQGKLSHLEYTYRRTVSKP